MADTKWTPGPWKVRPVFIAQQTGGALNFGEFAFPPQIEDGHSKTYDNTEAIATAHLMEAAPELYEALEKITSGLWIERAAEENSEVRRMLREARAALAKARGEICPG